MLSFACALFPAQAQRTHRTEVSIRGDDFYINNKPTYPHRTWQGHRIEGLLLNARMVNGIFDDLNPETAARWAYPDTHTWDPNRNTSEFIAALPTWRSHGLLAFTINLQGGSPEGYSHHGQPWTNSAFASDGSLRLAYFDRLARILDRADSLGMVAIVGLFYQGQDHQLAGDDAVIRAVDNAANWLLSHNYRNVLVEINNECDQHYVNAILQPQRVDELITRVHNIRVKGRRLLVSTSYAKGVPGQKVADAADFILVHGNGIAGGDKITAAIQTTRAMIAAHPKPIVFNEDDHTAFDTPDSNFAAAVAAHASWGFFDYRREGEPFADGFQTVPGSWAIDTDRKRAFFNLLSEITGESPPQ
jgi:hypothetical protein